MTEEPKRTLGWEDLRQAFVVYHDLLTRHREYLNRINVYPVADGDTGTNLDMTLRPVVADLEDATSMREVCSAVERGVLHGAQGTSGVILSQMLAEMAARFSKHTRIDGAALVEALEYASRAAYDAVIHPVEGTILTVSREAATSASVVASGTIREVLQAAHHAAESALRSTRGMLSQLGEAGVVDAGGAGFVLLLDAFLHVATDRPLPVAPTSVEVEQRKADAVSAARYEVVARLTIREGDFEEFKRRWVELGDVATVLSNHGKWWLVHIHTDDPDRAIEAARRAGDIEELRVTELPAG